MCEHRLKKNSVHCSGCHRDFGGVNGFDSHQRFDPFRCLPPPYRGLHLTDDGGVAFRQAPPMARKREGIEPQPLSTPPEG